MFLACVVEAVEALTVVLAAGTVRDWGSALTGVGAGLVVLAAVVAALGPALTAVPINGLRPVVGGLLLIFGLRWLRKAILRASGSKAFARRSSRVVTGMAIPYQAERCCSSGLPPIIRSIGSPPEAKNRTSSSTASARNTMLSHVV